MEWFAFAAPVPGPVDYGAAGVASLVVSLLVAAIPALLAARDVWARGRSASDALQLRVIDGGKEVARRAA